MFLRSRKLHLYSCALLHIHTLLERVGIISYVLLYTLPQTPKAFPTKPLTGGGGQNSRLYWITEVNPLLVEKKGRHGDRREAIQFSVGLINPTHSTNSLLLAGEGERSSDEVESWNKLTPHPNPLLKQRENAFHQTIVDYFYANAPKTVNQGFYHMIPNPQKGGAMKRMNMFLRWMVRKGPVDLGIWEFIQPKDLLIPLDVHVARVSREMKLLGRKSNDFQAVIELTNKLKEFCPTDPVKYDFAMFGFGVQ